MKKNSRTIPQIICAHTLTYFNLLNLILAGLVFLSGQYENMLFVGIVVSNSLIGIIQELRVKSLIDRLSLITATKVKKITDTGIREIPVDELAAGDRISLSSGDQIVADGTVLTSDGLEADESLLTGESVPVLKKAGDLLYSGSFIVAGSGTATVTHTGEESYAEKLVAKARNKKRATSEMQNAIKKIIRYVSYAIIPIGTALFCIQYFRAKSSLSDALVNTVAGVLGMIPEGLVLLTSVSFILGVGRLAKKRALVQEMEAIEALARVNVLCLDKTGTITTGEMKLQTIQCLTDAVTADQVNKILTALAFSSPDANATTKALQQYFHDTPVPDISDFLPFSSERKYMGISLSKSNDDAKASEPAGHFLLGAPDFLTKDPDVLRLTGTYTKRGLRVLLLGSCDRLYHSPDEIRNFSPLAVVALSDCIKEDAIPAFQYFAKQKVAIKILSGDDPVTVSHIGEKAGIEGSSRYVDASTLPEDEERLRDAVSSYTVFGRVSPDMKQRILNAYRAEGAVVGMVGDGVNDVPALKDADCGIAMANGADAAKQTAHIVLMDSDFAAMPDIVKEGRTTITNIERVSALYLTKTIYSVLLCVIFIIIGRSYPFIPIQLSLIGAAAIGIPSFLLTLERHEESVSSGFLRHVLRVSLPAALVLVAAICAVQAVAVPLHLSGLWIHTLNLLIGGAVSLSVVARVCHPWTKRRFLILTISCAVFAAAFLFFPNLFDVIPLLSR